MKKLIAALAFVPFVAHAEFLDGNELLKWLRASENNIESVAALGYIMGVADAHHGSGYCPPPNVKASQLNDMVKIFLEQNPTTRNTTADQIVYHVIKMAYPCQQKQRGNPA